MFKAVFARTLERSCSIDAIFVWIARKLVLAFVDIDTFVRLAAGFVDVAVIAAAFKVAFGITVIRIVSESAMRARTAGNVRTNRMTEAPVAEEVIFALACE